MPQACVASLPVTRSKTLHDILLSISPTPIGMTPGHLFMPIILHHVRALHAAQGGHVLASHSTMSAIVLLRRELAPPNFNSQWLNETESTPIEPADPDARFATVSTFPSEAFALINYGQVS